MRDSLLTCIASVAIWLCIVCSWMRPASAQSYSVTTVGDLATAIQTANAWAGSGPFTINFLTSGTIQPSAQMVIGLTLSNTSGLVINGNGATIDMAAANGGAGDRAFFVANGSIAMSNLTIANGKAIGGNGGNAAGGGAGLGGGIFVANAAAIPGIPQLPTSVSLTDVFFLNNQANGGNGSSGGSESYQGWGGGGGGMGGNGGVFYRGGLDTSGGGGGGFGVGADGGAAGQYGEVGTAGAMTVAGLSGGGAGGFNGAAGGATGGGGGGGNDGLFERGGGGGGGVGGQTPGTGSSWGYDGGVGGFGGGGGGGGSSGDPAGHGGFGGGGGSGDGSNTGSGSAGGAGGFGGGGGGNGSSSGSLSSPGGFGGGPGIADNSGSATYGSTGGGGGAGLGGAVFVMGGALLDVNFSGAHAAALYTNNAVSGGNGGYGTNAGSAYGPNVFVGGDVTYTVTSSTLAISGLGGAGNVADPNVANNRYDPNANGGLIKNGDGTLALSGWNTYSGTTVVNGGVLATSGSLGAMLGTSGITINPGAAVALGQSNGVNDAAVVTLNGGTLRLGTPLAETVAGITVTAPSVLDFAGTTSTLTMSTLSLAQPLAIWDFTSTARSITVTSGTYSGSLSNVTFYSDAGHTPLGPTYLIDTVLTPSVINVANGADLAAAITSVNAMTGTATIVLAQNGTIQPAAQSVISLNAANTGGLTIVGNGATIDMSQANGGAGDRAFFIAGGNVTLSNLTIANGVARGGAATDGGGGGAGLGGGIFVAAGNQIPSSTITLTTDVTLQNVSFTNNTAIGGNGAARTQMAAGGGGGLGGNAGEPENGGVGHVGGGGGGGFGFGATGGGDSPGSPGAAVFTTSGGGAAASGQPGGAAGGGGGGGGSDIESNSGGGGGIAGQSAAPGNGGWGGGGGGAAYSSLAGGGGFGGGGGGGFDDARYGNGTFGGWGGFGGGGGYGLYVPQSGGAGPGGFGGGQGAYADPGGFGGGGGMGAGGAVFVMAGASLRITGGTFGTNSVVSGTGYVNGSAYGPDFFLGANVVFDLDQNQSLTVVSLGGAGNPEDANVVDNEGHNYANDPNAQGGIIKTGSGTLVLTGTSYYTGPTIVNAGSLVLSGTALEQGTQQVIVGQNSGDVATFQLLSSSTMTLGGFNVNTPSASTDQPVMIAQNAGSTGQIVIGDGPGTNGAFIGARIFTGGSGTASVVFTQQYAASPGTDPVYPFYTTLTGSLNVVQQGLGRTVLQPLYGANTFSGFVTVNSGTLATTGTAAALGNVTSITVNAGGVLALGQNGGVNDLASLSLAGGVLQTSTSLSETFGALAVTGSTSLIDFLGNAATLNFATLDLGGHLSIWNYSGTTDFLAIATGTATGSLEQIAFYSDAGTTFLGYGGFESTRLVPVAVPEPSTIAMALAGLAAGGILRRRKRAASPHAVSPS
jgi:autotransporter-associated beta strand protein